MSQTQETPESLNDDETAPAVPVMTTVERAEMLLRQDAAIRDRIGAGATLDEAVDPSNKEFGPLAHPEQVQMRVAKRAMMLEAGMQPYPVHLDVTDTIEAVRAKYDGKLEAGQETEDVVGIAGRVLFLRNGGGLCFVQLSAGDGTKIQGMISKKEIGADSLKQFKQLVDLGDHLYLRGRVIASKTGELSVFATEWAIASKALQPLPALHKDLNDDTRTRKPYIGMIADEKVRNMVRNRSKAVASLRRTFDDHDFIEVETPMLQTIHGGAAARPFTTHMNAFDLDLYLRIAPELFLKRCLVGGIDRVFEINRDFRNEGVDATHAPEFTMVEAYQAYGTYDTIGQLVKELVQKTAMDVFGSHKVTLLDGTEYDFGGDWKTISMYDSLSEALGEEIVPNGGPDNPGTSVEHLGEIADKLGVERDDVENHGKLVEHLWEHFYEDKLYEPTPMLKKMSMRMSVEIFWTFSYSRIRQLMPQSTKDLPLSLLVRSYSLLESSSCTAELISPLIKIISGMPSSSLNSSPSSSTQIVIRCSFAGVSRSFFSALDDWKPAAMQCISTERRPIIISG